MLEHAFDCFLEAGEVPSVLIFTEMTCQAAIRHDYDRAVNIVNTMALAPFQMSLQQWINLLESNGDRIDRDCLSKLHEKIISNDSTKEATVFNLSKALEFVNGSCEKDSLNSTASISPSTEEIPKDSIDEESDATDDMSEQNFPANAAVRNLNWSRSMYDGGSLKYLNNCRAEEHHTDPDDAQEENATAFLSRLAEDFDHEVVSRISPSYLDDSEIEEDSDSDELNLEDIIPSSEVEMEEDEPESCTPSAYEILQIWKHN